MKLFHLSDIHLGKRLNEQSLLEDQRYILHQILLACDEEKPNAVLIAGDVYDKAIPPVEAVTLFDDFLYELNNRRIPVLLISGNHDSAERLAFGSRLFANSHVYSSPVYHGEVNPITLQDELGEMDFYLMPFVKPAHVRRFYPDEEIASYTDALRCAISHMNVDPSRRNVLLAHQFVTGATPGQSEELSVGGSENVDADVFEPFDYVALGHIHRAQQVTAANIRYCGSPLKYSFAEANHHKALTIVELGCKGQLDVKLRPLTPMRELRRLQGTYQELTDEAFYRQQDTQAYLHIVLTDDELIPNAVQNLRLIYPHLLFLSFDNKRTAVDQEIGVSSARENRSPLELFAELYEKQNNQPMTEKQHDYIQHLFECIQEGKA